METLLNHFWLLAMIANTINAIIFWTRAQPYIEEKPELRPGYTRLIRNFFNAMNIPWFIMAIGMKEGGISNVGDYFYPRNGNQFVIAWWVSIWSLILLSSYWIWFRGGAEKLIEYPGLFVGNPTKPQTIKSMWLRTLIGSIVASAIVFSLEPK